MNRTYKFTKGSRMNFYIRIQHVSPLGIKNGRNVYSNEKCRKICPTVFTRYNIIFFQAKLTSANASLLVEKQCQERVFDFLNFNFITTRILYSKTSKVVRHTFYGIFSFSRIRHTISGHFFHFECVFFSFSIPID